MLVIRLQRTGKKHDPHYRLVVQESRSRVQGKFTALIGHYHPATPQKELVIDAEQATYWMSKGAQPSDTVTNLLVRQGILPESAKVRNFYTPKPKEEAPVVAEAPAAVAEEVAAEESAAETPEAEVAAEAPAEEVVAEEPAAEEAAPAEEAPESTEETPAEAEVTEETPEETPAEEPAAEQAAETPAEEPAAAAPEEA
jgi:small subunit ribosomal protein S16